MTNQRVSPLKHFLIGMSLLVLPIVSARAESGPDAWITMQALSAVRAAEGTRASAVAIDTSDGYVTLHGKVRSQTIKARVAADALRVPGVVGVRNLLQVVTARDRAGMQRSDDAVRADVQGALRNDPSLDDSRITVRSVSNGVVLLGGEVISSSDNVRALRATADRPGVRQVYSEIGAMPAVRAELVATGDNEIRRGVVRALYDLEVSDSGDIRVVVVNGVVWLSGTVPAWQGNASRMYAVRSVTGVRSIMNVLRVVPGT